MDDVNNSAQQGLKWQAETAQQLQHMSSDATNQLSNQPKPQPVQSGPLQKVASNDNLISSMVVIAPTKIHHMLNQQPARNLNNNISEESSSVKKNEDRKNTHKQSLHSSSSILGSSLYYYNQYNSFDQFYMTKKVPYQLKIAIQILLMMGISVVCLIFLTQFRSSNYLYYLYRNQHMLMYRKSIMVPLANCLTAVKPDPLLPQKDCPPHGGTCTCIPACHLLRARPLGITKFFLNPACAALSNLPNATAHKSRRFTGGTTGERWTPD